MDDDMNELLLPASRSAPLPHASRDGAGSASTGAPTPYSKYIDILLARKSFIVLVTCVCALAGALYAWLAPPVYRAALLVQVDDAPPLGGRVFGETGKVVDLPAATAAELEVLRSRLVVARAVDSLQLFIDVRPRYLPLIGRWLAARHEGWSEPGLFGRGGYVWGAESAAVSQFDVPAKFLGSSFVLTAGPANTYTLVNADAGLRLSGRVGEAERWTTARGDLALTVTSLQARPGAQFTLRRHVRLESIEELQQDLKVAEQGKQSGVIEVSLEGTDPVQLARILNEIGRQYLAHNEQRRSAGAEKSLAFLERQLPALKQSLEQAEANYNDMRNRYGSIDLGDESKGLLQLSVAAQTKLMDLAQKRAELASRYQGAHPLMLSVDQQINALNRELAGLDVRIKRLPKVEQEIVRLSRDVKVSTDVYTAVLASAQQLRLSAASRVGNAQLLDEAETPVTPVKPKRYPVVAAATLFGLLLSSFLACTRALREGQVDEPLEVERQLGLPLTAAIPHSEGQQAISARLAGDIPLRGPALLQSAMPDDGAIESLRRLRSLLQRTLAGTDSNIVVITGPSAGVGKSFVAANFAAVLASAGKKVLLVDADLRTGRLHRTFATERGPGLAEYLAGRLASEQAIRPHVLPHVDMIPTGALPPNPAELLAQDRLRELLQTVSPRYDYVLVDTAPVLPVSDALSIVALGAVTLNVVRSGVTTAVEVDETARQLRQAGARSAGVVVNGFRSRSRRYGYNAAYPAAIA
jgi:tyrosine-protein kinase Etk/Wzc